MANLKKISTFAASKSTSFHIFPVKSIKKQVRFTMRGGGAKCEQSKLYHISLICTTSFN